MRCFLLFYGAIWYNIVKELLHTPPANTLPIAEGQTEFIVICYNNKRTIISSPEASSLNHLRCLIQGAVKKNPNIWKGACPIAPVRRWRVQNQNIDNVDLLVVFGCYFRVTEKHFICGKFVKILLQSLHPNQTSWDMEKGLVLRAQL